MMGFSAVPAGRDSPAMAVFRAALFAAVVVAIGYFVALKIFHVPTRKDILVFFILVSIIPVLKFPTFGLFYLFIVPPFIPFIRRFYYTFYDRPEQDLFHVVPDIVVILLALVFFDRLRKGIRPRVEDAGLQIWLWVFMFYQLIRTYVLNYASVTDGLHQFKFTVLYLLCFFFAVHFIDSRRQVTRIFRITVVLGLVIALYGIKQTLFGFSHFEEIWLKYMKSKFVTLFIEGIPRPFSFLASPACFADFMILAVVACFSLFTLEKRAGRMLYLAAVPVLVYGLLLTSVRTNWIGLMFGAVVWFIIAHRGSMRRKVALITALVVLSLAVNSIVDVMYGGRAAAAAAALSGVGEHVRPQATRNITDVFVKDRITAVADPFAEHSMISRVVMWQMVLRQSFWWPQGPFGWGLGTFDAHSYYMTTLFETGYPGLFLLLFILFRVFRAGFKVYREEEERESLALIRGILVSLFAIAFVNTTGTHVASHPADIYFWTFAGILMVIRRLKGEGRFRPGAGHGLLNDPT